MTEASSKPLVTEPLCIHDVKVSLCSRCDAGSPMTDEVVEKAALKRLAMRLEKSGRHGYVTMSTSDLRAIYALSATPLVKMREALEAAREAIKLRGHLREEAAMKLIDAALSSNLEGG